MRCSTFSDLHREAAAAGKCGLVIAGALSDSALHAAEAALQRGLVHVHLVGPAGALRERLAVADLGGLRESATVHDAHDDSAAAVAVRLVRDGTADVLLKGSIRTDQLLRAVLDRNGGLRDGLLSDVLLYEDRFRGETRLVGVTDGGISVQPTVDDLRRILLNGTHVMRALGVSQPRVAVLSASEAVSEAMPSSGMARALQQAGDSGELGDCVVAGPLALDNILLESAARAKGIHSVVAGNADLIVVPNIEAGNVLGKAVKYLYGSITAHIVVGGRAPVLIPSRVESAEDKLASIALGVLIAQRSA
jgi:phosphate butyryltransferase